MKDDRPTEVLGALPRTRPHRRSDKRAAPPSKASPGAEQPAPTAAEAERPRAGGRKQPATAARKRQPAAARKQPTAAGRKQPAAAVRKQPRAAEREPAEPTPIRTSPARKARPQRLRQPAQPAGTPVARRERAGPSPPSGTEILGTVVNAAAELAEIGLTAGARALRNALTRLPRP